MRSPLLSEMIARVSAEVDSWPAPFQPYQPQRGHGGMSREARQSVIRKAQRQVSEGIAVRRNVAAPTGTLGDEIQRVSAEVDSWPAAFQPYRP